MVIRDISITREDLPAMVLTYAEIEDELPDLQLDTEGSGYRDNTAAAKGTVDPDDTAADLTAAGRIDGYDHEFSDQGAVFATDPSSAGPYLALVIVDLFDSAESAEAFVQSSLDAFVRFQGQEMRGVIIAGFEQSEFPELGAHAVTGSIDQRIVGFEVESRGTFVLWTRGPLVARVLVVTLGLRDLSLATEELARRMDRRIAGVRAGEISATPIVPTPTVAAALGGEGGAALAQGFDLAAMLLSPQDFPEGAEAEQEGFVPGAPGVVVYLRKIGLDASMELGSSKLIEVTQSVALEPTLLEAESPIRLLQTMDLETFKELVARSFVQELGQGSGGAALDSLQVERIDDLMIGDLSAVFVMSLKTVISEFDFVMVFFSTGPVSVQMVFTGPGGELALDDALSLASTVEARVVANSP